MQIQTNFVGVKYIGSKPMKTDNITNSGAVWMPEQVHNFSEDIAVKLLAHSSVWEKADATEDGNTFVGQPKKQIQQEPIAFVNINAMEQKQLLAYARLNFNISLSPDKSIEDLRTEIQSLMVNATLDETQAILKELQDTKKTVIALEVSEAEYQAYVEGSLELKLVPKLAHKEPSEPAPVADTQTNEEQTTQEHAQNDAQAALPELLAKLDKPALLQLARESKIPFSNTMTEDMLRTKILSYAPQEGQ